MGKTVIKLLANLPSAFWWLGRWLASAWMEEKVLPPLYFLSEKVGIPVLALEGFITGVIFAGSVAWVIVSLRNQRRIPSEDKPNLLDEIKSELVLLSELERNTATVKAKKPCPDKVAEQIHDDFVAVFNQGLISFVTSLLQRIVTEKNSRLIGRIL